MTRDDEGLPAFGVFARFGTTGRDEKTPIGLILVYSADIRTPHGLGVGSTIAEIKALGAKKISTDRFDDDGGYVFDPWVITGTGGELVFWIWQGTDKKAGYTVGRVSFELVQEKGTKPYFPYELDNCS